MSIIKKLGRYGLFVAVTLACISVLSLMIYGGYRLYQEVTPQYSQELTARSYVDAAEAKNVNLVFYRKNCPYCRTGKAAVIKATKKAPQTTYFIDVETQDGQKLVKQYGVSKAATMVTIRNGQVNTYQYAKKTKDGHYEANIKQIQEALND